MEVHEDYMKQAIGIAKRHPQHPFGSLIIHRGGQILEKAVNNVIASPVLHGELHVIHQCALNHPEGLDWSELALYTTAEPCPMCMGAIIWSGIGRVIFGTSSATLMKKGWRQFDLNCSEMLDRASFARCEVISGVLESECDALFSEKN